VNVQFAVPAYMSGIRWSTQLAPLLELVGTGTGHVPSTMVVVRHRRWCHA